MDRQLTLSAVPKLFNRLCDSFTCSVPGSCSGPVGTGPCYPFVSSNRPSSEVLNGHLTAVRRVVSVSGLAV